MAIPKYINFKRIIFVVKFLLIFHIAFSQQTFVTHQKYYTPDYDSPFFKKGNDIGIIDNVILVLENPKHHILMYTIANNDKLIFKGFLTQKGQGPGDTVLPLEISIWDDKIAIVDSTGCSIFSKKGEFLEKFRIFTSRISFLYTAEKVYIAQSNPNSQFLINVYTTAGKQLDQFGENLLNIDYSVHHNRVKSAFVKGVFYGGKLVTDGKWIYYLNRLFGKVFVFNLEGKLIKTASIVPCFDPKDASDILEWNNKLLKKGIKPDKDNMISVVTKEFFSDVYLLNDKIYLLNSYRESLISPVIKVRVLDKQKLELINTILIKKTSDEDRITSIAIKDVNGKTVIFAAMEIKDGSAIGKFVE